MPHQSYAWERVCEWEFDIPFAPCVFQLPPAKGWPKDARGGTHARTMPALSDPGPSLDCMPDHDRETPSPDALNDAIRTLYARAGEERRPLTADEQRIYRVLVAAWTEAVQGDQELAA